MKKIFLTILFLFLSLSLSFAQTEMELVSNGGFEDGLTGWNFYSLNPNYASYSLDENSVITGTNSAKIKIDTSYHGYPSGRISLNTVVDIESGVEYTISFKLRSTKPIQGNAIWWAFYDTLETNDYYSGNWGQVKLDADTTIEYTATWTSDFTDTDVLFSLDFAGIQSDDLEIWVDDVSITTKTDVPPIEPAIVGQWDFNDPSYLEKATVGEDLLLFGNHPVSDGPKEGDGAILLGKGDYLKAVSNLPAMGEGSYSNTYTLSMDIKVDVQDGFNCLLQTDLANTNDGSLFITAAKTMGYGTIGYSTPIFTEAEWQRVILVVEEINADTVNVNIYINGTHGYKGNNISVDGRLGIRDSVFFFRDNDGEEKPTDVSQVVLYNYALSADEIAELGTPMKKEEIQDPLPKGTELIANYGFNDGLNGWNFYSKNPVYASNALDATGVINGPNSVKVNVDTTYANYPSGNIALFTSVPIEEGQKYYLTFKIKSTKAINDKAIWWSMYDSLEANSYYNGMWGQVTLGADSIFKYETNFTADFTDATTDFSIDFAAIPSDSTTMWLDDIHLIKLKQEEDEEEPPLPNGTELLTNTGFNDELNNWNFFSLDSGYASYQLDNNSVLNGPNSALVDIVTAYKGYPSNRISLNQQVAIEDGKEYYIRFTLKSTKAIQGNAIWWAFYDTVATNKYYNGIWGQVKVDADTAVMYETTFTADFNDPDVFFSIDFAGIESDSIKVWLDDIHLIELSDIEPKLPEGTDLISNNYFNDGGLDKWDLSKTVQSYATLSLDESSALEGEKSGLVHINNVFTGADESWKIQFRQSNLSTGVKEDKGYHIQFMIKANKDVTGISAVIQKRYGDFGNIYSKDISLVADEMLTVIDTFDCAVTDTNITFGFNLGTASVKDVDIWFDAVHLIEMDGYTVDVKKEDMLPKVYALNQNYPNPFNPTTVISFALPKTSDVQLSVYNILGQKVMELVNGKMVAGNHIVNFNAGNLASGMYIYRIKAGSFVSVKKMMLLK